METLSSSQGYGGAKTHVVEDEKLLMNLFQVTLGSPAFISYKQIFWWFWWTEEIFFMQMNTS